MLSRKPKPSTDVQHISVSIKRSYNEVYKFASNPENLPRWVEGLTGSMSQVDGEWVAESTNGKIKVRFADPNPFGVLDHEMELENGYSFTNILRVVPNEQGCEIIFTLFRQSDKSPAEFEEDGKMVEADLSKLKGILEAED